jgi:hypothetical protein
MTRALQHWHLDPVTRKTLSGWADALHGYAAQDQRFTTPSITDADLADAHESLREVVES